MAEIEIVKDKKNINVVFIIFTLNDCDEIVLNNIYLLKIGDDRWRFDNLSCKEQFKMIKNGEWKKYLELFLDMMHYD